MTEISAEIDNSDFAHVQWLIDSMPFPCLAVDYEEVIRESNKRARDFFGPFIKEKPISEVIDNFTLQQSIIHGFIGKGQTSMNLTHRGYALKVFTAPLIDQRAVTRV
ncbi:MAG: hypothetical protein WAZ30_06785, partial [Syntrophorhabdus sp.]